MIRLANPNDVDDIASLGLEFVEKSMSAHTFEPNLGKLWELFHTAATGSEFILIVLEEESRVVGFIFGMILAPCFSEEVVLQEVGMYVQTGFSGLHLLDAFEREAEIRGIKKVVVGCKPGFCDLGNYYKRKGYKLLEVQYLKEI